MKNLLGIAAGAALLALQTPVVRAEDVTSVIRAADVSGSKLVHGVVIHLGVAPAATILARASQPEEFHMHGGVPTGANHYHVMVALFDKFTGNRITGAKVDASVEEFGMGAAERKVMEPMTVAGQETYGNYFTLRNPGIYRIHVAVHGVSGKPALQTEFEYRR